MSVRPNYFREHIEAELPRLETPEQRDLAEHVHDILVPEDLGRGVHIEIGKDAGSFEFFNRLLGVEAGIKGGALHFNQVILNLGAEQNYATAHRGGVIPILMRRSLVESMIYAQATVWDDWRRSRPESRRTSSALTRLLIAQPLERTSDSHSDITSPWISMNGSFGYNAHQRKQLGDLVAALVPEDDSYHTTDLEARMWRDHPSFVPYALERHLEAGGKLPTLSDPDYSITIGTPRADFWIPNHVQAQRAFRLDRSGRLEEIRDEFYDEDVA